MLVKGLRCRARVPLATHGVAGWLTAALELSGAHRVDVREIVCVHDGAPACKWRAEWV